MSWIPASLRTYFVEKRSRTIALVDQAIVSASNFFITVLVARFAGLEELGIFSVFWLALLLVLSFLSAIVFSPLFVIGPKLSPHSRVAYVASLSKIFGLALSAIATISILLYWVLRFFDILEIDFTYFFCFLSAFYLVSIHEFGRRVGFLNRKYFGILVSDLLRHVLQLTLVLLIGFTAEITAKTVLLISAIGAGAAIFFVIPGDIWSVRFKRRAAKAIVHRHYMLSRWLIGATMTQWLGLNLTFFVAAIVLGPVAAGGLRAVQTLVGLTHVIFQALENFVPARVTTVFSQQGAATSESYMRGIGFQLVSAVSIICLVFAIFSNFLIANIFGDEYRQYSGLVWAYSGFYILQAFAFPYRMLFLAREKTSQIFLPMFLAAMWNVLTILPFVNWYGLFGVGWSIVLYQAVLAVSMCMLYHTWQK